MRKGWKTRIDERHYFEEKKQTREDRIAIMHAIDNQMLKSLHDAKMTLLIKDLQEKKGLH